MKPKPYDLPDGIVLTTLGEVKRCGWVASATAPRSGNARWNPPSWFTIISDDDPVFAREHAPPSNAVTLRWNHKTGTVEGTL